MSTRESGGGKKETKDSKPVNGLIKHFITSVNSEPPLLVWLLCRAPSSGRIKGAWEALCGCGWAPDQQQTVADGEKARPRMMTNSG